MRTHTHPHGNTGTTMPVGWEGLPWWLGEAPPWLIRWFYRHRRWLAVWLISAGVSGLAGATGTAACLALLGIVPGLVFWQWAQRSPRSYELLIARPSRRFGWWWFARRRWDRIARVCGLSERQVVGHTRAGANTGTSRTSRGRPGTSAHGQEMTRWVAPRLRRVRTRPHSVELTIRARAGQTLDELETGAARLATTFAALSYRVRPISGSTVRVLLVMLDELAQPTTAEEPEPRAIAEAVTLGRTQDAHDWRLQLRGRHTLVAGCSGSGKGSVLWGICCGLSPAVHTDVARLWGIDLKRGVELAMGQGLFSAHAYTPAHAVRVLRALMDVIDERGQAMAGVTRLHQPMVGDPLHVLVIDELAALTAYADLDVRREANRLLAEILTQGRALGVVVVACVQDPRKEVVSMRELFTQTIALRLRTGEETAMVLGDGMARLAPAHRISPTHPGTGWIVDETGATDRVRADYWPDDLIRTLAHRYATENHTNLTPADDKDGDGDQAQDTDERTSAPKTPRKPRAARKPRQPRQPRREPYDREDGAA